MPQQKKLSKRLIKQLGKKNDSELSREFDLPVSVIRAQRVFLGIPNAKKNRWDEKAVALLGTASDAKVAEMLGITQTAVYNQRRKRGIKPFGPSRGDLTHKWTKTQLKWLGKKPDAVIARELGLNQTTVGYKRRSLGITAVNGRAAKPWTKQEIAVLGKMSDTDAAEVIGRDRRKIAIKRNELGIPNYTVKNYTERWTPEIRKRLGKDDDRVIAEQLGIAVGTVTAYRMRHLIEHKNAVPKIKWSKSHLKKLGTVPDQQIAQKMGISISAVATKRASLDIPAFEATQTD